MCKFHGHNFKVLQFKFQILDIKSELNHFLHHNNIHNLETLEYYWILFLNNANQIINQMIKIYDSNITNEHIVPFQQGH